MSTPSSTSPDAPTDPASLAAALLRVFKEQPTAWQLPADLAERTSATRNTLFEAVDHLRNQGYSVEFHPYFGFRLVQLPTHFVSSEVSENLNTRHVGRRVLTFDSLGSTSDMAWELAEKGEDDGAVVLAEEQVRGRARMGHQWHSPRGKGVYLSILLRPAKETPDADLRAHYAVAAALAVAHTLNDICHLHAQIRWPDDVFVGMRKIASVLCETRPEHPGALVIGLGLNTRMLNSDLPDELRNFVTSVQIETGTEINHNRLVRYLLFYFDGLYQKLRRRRTRPVAAGLREYSALANHEVLVTDNAGEHRGKVTDVEPTRLLLATDDGDLAIDQNAVRSVRVIQ